MIRDCAYDPEFEKSSEVLGSPEQADNRMRAVEWYLSRETDFSALIELGKTAGGQPIYAFKTTGVPSAAAIIVVFSIEDEHPERSKIPSVIALPPRSK